VADKTITNLTEIESLGVSDVFPLDLSTGETRKVNFGNFQKSMDKLPFLVVGTTNMKHYF